MATFSQRNEISQDSWTKRVFSRMGKLPALNGRDNLRAALHPLGFPLR